MAQQTAVEWLESKFQKFLLYYEGNHKAEPYTIQELSNDFEQAKQMEKEQIKEAHLNGQSEWDIKSLGDMQKKLTEEYYNETYKKQ